MRSRYLASLLVLTLLIAARPAGAQPQMKDYMTTPFWLDNRTVPLVMLVLERDWKMFYPAYNNLADLDGDGALDIGFNPGVTYVGYFDSNSCYTYTRETSGNNETGHFTRAGETTPQTQTEADAAAISRGIDQTNLVYPASAHGVCGGGTTRDGLGQWHGNWLNFAMTSRMDAIRKVLYGGKRTTDTATKTVLELVRVPANANVWGGELYADDIWEEYAPSSPWYNIADYTGFDSPAPGTMHFWARGDYFWTSPDYQSSSPTPSSTSTQQQNIHKNTKPLFRVVTNIPSTNRHPFLKSPLRYWDWTGDHASYNSIPSDGHLYNSKGPDGATNNGFVAVRSTNSGRVGYHFAAQVEVCKKGIIGLTEGCRPYGDIYKPSGLLQEYGESGKMYFGLLTGTIYHPSPRGVDSGTRYKGGVVRHAIQNFSNYVDSNGIIVRPGLIDTIDVFEITGVGTNNTNTPRTYGDGTQAGNPLGEMVWEALRYLGRNVRVGGLQPTTAYGPNVTETTVTSTKDASNYRLPKLSSWAARIELDDAAEECPKPIILAISEVFPDNDGDDFTNLGDLRSAPLSDFTEGGPLPATGQPLVINDYLKIITENDQLSSSAAGGKLFFYPGNSGVCTAKTLTGGLEDVLGHCPSEPSLRGTYSLAAVAYYAHTHDFPSFSGEQSKTSNVDFYAVGIPGNFPDITLALDDQRSMTLMPIAMAAPDNAPNSQTEGMAHSSFRTLLNFFIEYWQTDDGYKYDDENGIQQVKKIPYKVKFRTNFEFTLYPCFVQGGNSNNWERDLFSAVTISLLTPQTTGRQYREAAPLFISSGPFKTRDPGLYRRQRDRYQRALADALTVEAKALVEAAADTYFEEIDDQKYYYAFKKTRDVPLDLRNHNVVGAAVHTDSTGSGYGASGLTGYTITGVTFPGAYLDVGLNRSDYPIYYSTGTSSSNCRPSKTVFVPNAVCGDEAVPLDPAGSGLPGAQWNYATSSGSSVHGTTPSGFNSHRSGSSVYTNNADCGYYHPPTMWDDRLTPAECPYAGYTDTSPWTDPDLLDAYGDGVNRPRADNVCGRWAAGYTGSINSKTYPSSTSYEGDLFRTSLMRYVQVRSFKFDASNNKPEALYNPMWLAAKYGGFKDSSDDRGTSNAGVPDKDGEWKRNGLGADRNDPYNYFGVANISELPTQLGKAFEAIANSVATGTANASSISTVLGGGLSLQTQYRPEYEDPGDASNQLKWTGAVYAFFVDKWGNLRADSDGDKKLTVVTSPDGKGDLIVHTVILDEDQAEPYIYLCRDNYGNNNGNTLMPTDVKYENEGKDQYPPDADCQLVKKPEGFQNLDFGWFELAQPVWNAAQKLTEMGPDARRVYTYYDYGKTLVDGKYNKYDWSQDYAGGFGIDLSASPFTIAGAGSATSPLHKLMGQATFEETKNLIQYIRGHDGYPQYRNRTAVPPWDPAGESGTPVTWIMGDVINSKPVIVGDAAGNYHLLYGSQSYADFKSSDYDYCYGTSTRVPPVTCRNDGASKRRHVAYFGSNGGVLHAVNLGFFGALSDGKAGYKTDSPTAGYTERTEYASLEPGDELWAYVPTAVLPHLQWLADPEYTHGFFVDLKPYAADITDANGRWKSILLVGLRMGGRTIELVNAPEADGTKVYSYSEYFALDVTEPDSGPPRLLWRFAHPNLGLTTATPKVVRWVDPSTAGGSNEDHWFAILPSGPTSDVNYNGRRVPADTGGELAYEGRSNQRARVFIVNARTGELMREPDESDTQYPLVVPDDVTGEVLDGRQYSERDSFFNDTFMPRAVYVPEGSGGDKWSHHAVYMGLTATKDDTYDTGAMYRLQMADTDGTPLPLARWQLRRMYKTNKPVTGAANAAYDSLGNLWVVFGTGRVWAPNDLAPCGISTKTKAEREQDLNGCCQNHDQYLYGLKEPLTARGYMTFEEIPVNTDIADVSRVLVYEDGRLAGNIGGLKPADGTVTDYDRLYRIMIRKTNPMNGYKRKMESWWVFGESEDRRNYAKFEVITTQPKIDGVANNRSNTVFTSYETSANICTPGGYSFLNVVDTFTGLPAPYMASYGGFSLARGMGSGVMSGLKRAGKNMASEAWVLKSGGSTIYGNTSFNSNRNMIYVDQEQALNNAIVSWREVLDMGLKLIKKKIDGTYDAEDLYKDLTTP